ncbi:hypothetical protein C9J41_03995 [Photobacterium sp. GB-50]|uniref:hypothetical protein n=1 Tax=Photobacterium sp. GB-50 TaxID=2022107 RepID=UPI000D1583C5|nr:hypothetical protein [Photobacterium sp. GB-50]PSW74864.1 hypothetical protein C9J41_03995 [Photobacterium sp. GB-50]
MLRWIVDFFKFGTVTKKSLFEQIDSELISQKKIQERSFQDLEYNLWSLAKFLNKEFGTKCKGNYGPYLIDNTKSIVCSEDKKPIYISYYSQSFDDYLLQGDIEFDVNFSFSTGLISHRAILKKSNNEYCYKLLDSEYDFNYMYEFSVIIKEVLSNR